MKKNIILLVFVCLVCMNAFAYDVDVIITKSREQILCMIISQDGDSITYENRANLDDKQVYQIAKSDVAKIFIHDLEPVKSVPTVSAKPTPLLEVKSEPKIEKVEEVKSEPKVEKVAPVVEEAPAPQPEVKADLIITMDAQQIKAKVIEVSKNEIKYKELDNFDGPTFVLNTEEISSIIYSNGKVSVMQHEPKNVKEEEKVISSEVPINSQVSPVRSSSVENVSLARAKNYSGVYVFTDCTPVANYEVLGDITNANISSGGSGFSYYRIGGTVIASSNTSTPQYNDIRDQLVINAVMANREVEGILITIPKEGEGRATMIKFTDQAEDKSLAKVSSHLGVYVFTDCTPVTPFTFVGKIPNAGGLNSAYDTLRDKLITKVLRKFPEAKGIITHFVTGGKDSAEAIKF